MTDLISYMDFCFQKANQLKIANRPYAPSFTSSLSFWCCFLLLFSLLIKLSYNCAFGKKDHYHLYAEFLYLPILFSLYTVFTYSQIPTTFTSYQKNQNMSNLLCQTNLD